MSLRLIATLLAMLLLPAVGSPVRAAEDPTRIMLVHGVWVSGPWQQAFQNGLADGLAEKHPGRYELSHQLLGLYGRDSPEARRRIAAYVEATVTEQDIRWVVCTLPAACAFIMELDLPGVRRILVAADQATQTQAAGRNDVTVVASGAPAALRGTLDAIATLRGGTRVHLLSGSSSNDRRYLDMALAANAARSTPLPVEVVVAEAADTIERTLANMDPVRDTGFLLTTEAWGSPPTRYAPGALDRSGRAAAAPLFVFWDAAVGHGPVGGTVTSARAYATQVAGLVSTARVGTPLPGRVEGAASPLYDARMVDRWDLDLAALGVPVEVINEQVPLWETNPVAVATAVAVAGVLLSVITLLSSVLWVTYRAQRERARRAADEAARQAEQGQRQKLEALGNLAAGIAHDFNNVLGVVVGLTDLLRQPDTSRADGNRLLNQLAEAADRGKRLVGQILTFSRQSRGRSEALDLTALVDRTVAQHDSILPAGVALTVQRADPPIRVDGDLQRLEQVFSNLVTNAIEALGAHGGTVAISTRLVRLGHERTCTVGQLQPGTWAEITVSDDGPGIPEEVMARVFEPFYTSKALGSGIGLAIVHGVVGEHGGAIDVETAPGRGALFRIWLPGQALADGPSADLPQEQPDAAATAPESASGLHVLLVDDQPELLDVVAEMCSALGHRVTRCDSSRTALDLLDGEVAVDLLVTDYSMPEMDGLSLIRACRERHPTLRCVLTTGYAEQETRAQARACGAETVLSKPVRLDDLQATLAGATSPTA